MTNSECLVKILEKQDFTHFVTLTCRQQPCGLAASRRIAENSYKYILKTGSYFWVSEKFAFKRGQSESFHIHGLISQPGHKIFNIWNELFERYGRSRIEPIRSVDAVRAYVAKYVTKELSDYDFVFVKPNNQLWIK